jgi:hypothetical protein
MMSADCYVYRIDALDFTPVYIGAGRDGRWLRNRKQSPNKRLAELVAAGGARPPVKIREGITKIEAFAAEVELIALYGRADLGLGTLLNLTNGGAGAAGYIKSAEHRAAISAAARNMSVEHREKLSAAWLGKKRGPQSAEHRAKLRAANLGRELSAEHCANMSAARLGKKRGPQKPRSAEHRANISAALVGKKRAPFSAEHRAKISASAKNRRSPNKPLLAA